MKGSFSKVGHKDVFDVAYPLFSNIQIKLYGFFPTN